MISIQNLHQNNQTHKSLGSNIIFHHCSHILTFDNIQNNWANFVNALNSIFKQVYRGDIPPFLQPVSIYGSPAFAALVIL